MAIERTTPVADTPKPPLLWVTLLVAAAIGLAIYAAAQFRVATGQAPDIGRAFEHLAPFDDPAAMANFTA